ncbi:hypothetical protein ACFQ08_43870 [Streptosporangium algeriense]|uniref:DUF4177 domain-containing protein n=1 Tax=Streptosporangium algeriense TaxID=1682748 RepID=A0ABW3E919_9ACTN
MRTRWEYFTRTYSYRELDQVLAAAGADGWELVSHTPEQRQLIFKRPRI